MANYEDLGYDSYLSRTIFDGNDALPVDTGGAAASSSVLSVSTMTPGQVQTLIPPNAIVPSSVISTRNPGEDFFSSNFVSGTSGYAIYGTGDVEFNNGTFRGALSASTIDIGGSDATSFHVDIDGNVWAGSATLIGAPFSVTSAGALTATGATISGSITATSGAIGGWTINAASLTDLAGTVGMSSAVTGADDIRFWAGDATPGSAEFRVYESGALVASSATITGAITATSGSIGSFTIGTYLYTGSKTAYNDANAGVHLGSDGIGIANNLFTVSGLGVITAVSGTIGGCVLSTTSIGSTTFVSGPLGSGWNISNTGTAEFQNVTVRGVIRTSVFEKDTISAVNGIVLVSSADVLSADMTALDASTITISGQTTFSANEVIRIKDGTDDEWMLVTNAAAAPTYTVTRDLAGSYGANSNPIWKTGTAVVSMGVGTGTKTGFVLIDSSSANSPYIDVYGRNSNTYSDYTLHGRFGWLKGITDADVGLATTDVWGLYTDNAYIKGVIVANTGYIGGSTGWVITANYIKDVAGVTGLSSVVTGGDDIRIWAGHATPASAPFYVTEAGALVATSATISGSITATTGTIGGFTIAATTIASTGLTMTSGASASLAFGTVVPTSPTVGTGIYIDKTGLFGLSANTQNFKIDATNGNITSIAGTIAAFTIAGTTLSATNLTLTSGAANTANITVGTGATAGGMNSANSGTDIAFWAGSTFANRATAPFRVTAAGSLVSTSAVIGGYTINSSMAFGGSGADGALTIASGTTTIDLANADIVVKNYTSISISAGATLAFSNPGTKGTVIILKSQGDVTIAGAVTASSLGGAGGTSSSSGSGANGTGAIGYFSGTMGGSGGTVGSNTVAPPRASGGSGLPYPLTYTGNLLRVTCGAGGGRGGAGKSQGAAGGVGGKGGGGLVIECAGTFVYTGTVTVAGDAGTVGDAGFNSNGAGGGGGGGAGGVFGVIYSAIGTNSGVTTVSGGAGGSGGTGAGGGAADGGGNGGGGGGNRYDGSVGSLGVVNQVNSNGGAGGAGAAGDTYIVQNI